MVDETLNAHGRRDARGPSSPVGPRRFSLHWLLSLPGAAARRVWYGPPPTAAELEAAERARRSMMRRRLYGLPPGHEPPQPAPAQEQEQEHDHEAASPTPPSPPGDEALGERDA